VVLMAERHRLRRDVPDLRVVAHHWNNPDQHQQKHEQARCPEQGCVREQVGSGTEDRHRLPPAAAPTGSRRASGAFSFVTRSRLRRLPGSGRTRALRPSGSSGTAEPPALARRSLVDRPTATRARSLAATRHLVYGRPSAPFGLRLADAALFVTFFYVLGLALLLFRIFGFIAARHSALRVDHASIAREQAVSRPVPCRVRVLSSVREIAFIRSIPSRSPNARSPCVRMQNAGWRPSVSGRIFACRSFGSVRRLGKDPHSSGSNVPGTIVDTGDVSQLDDPHQLAIAINHRQAAYLSAGHPRSGFTDRRALVTKHDVPCHRLRHGRHMGTRISRCCPHD
jgi:hypothetical protein